MLSFFRSTAVHLNKSIRPASKVFKSTSVSSIFATTSVRTLRTEPTKLQTSESRAKLNANPNRSVFSTFKPIQNLSNLFTSSTKKATNVQTRALQTTTTATAQPTTGFFNKPLSFWRNWLLAASAGLGIFGLDMMLFQNILDNYLWNKLLFSKSMLHETFTPEIKNFVHFTFGLLGAVTAGWATLMYYHIKNTFATRDIRAWNAIAVSLGLWFVLDSSFSVLMGYWPNAILNVDLAILFAIPMLASRKYFKKIEGPTA